LETLSSGTWREQYAWTRGKSGEFEHGLFRVVLIAGLAAIGKTAVMTHPVRKLGRIAFRRLPFARLDDVAADAALAMQRDLRQAPTPISGGMRKALHKELAQQDALRRRSRRPYREADARRAYGQLLAACTHCGHAMYFDAIDDVAEIRCDRCKRKIW
jgi:hypothetical protein